MRRLSIGKKINALYAAIIIAAFIAVLIAAAFTLPTVSTPALADSTISGASGGNSLPQETAGSSGTVSDADGDGTTLEILGAEQVSGLADGELPIPSGDYIKAKGYDTDANWQAITSAAELKSWLTGSQDKNAYLVGNIDNFNHGSNIAALGPNAIVKRGKTLDGCGYTINVTLSGSGSFQYTKSGLMSGFFVSEVLGVLKNTKFTFKKIDGGEYTIHPGDNNVGYPGLIIGSVGNGDTGESNMAVVENVSLEILPFDNGGTVKIACWTSSSSTSARIRYGGLAGVVKNGIVRNATLIQSGGTIILRGGNSRWPALSSYCDSGTLIGQVGWGDSITSYAYNLSSYGNQTSYKGVDFGGAKLGTIGIVENIDMRGIYVESKATADSGIALKMFVSQPAMGGTVDKTHLFNQSLYSKTDGDRGTEAFFRLDANVDIRFAKPDPMQDTMSLADYQAACTRVILNDTTARDDGTILWRVNRASMAALDQGVFDKYETYGLMQQAGPNTYISLSTRANQAVNGTGGNRIHFVYGEKLTLDSLESKTVTYNGTAQSSRPKYLTAAGTEYSADAGHYKMYYNGSEEQPILPSGAAYKVTVRCANNANYAYFDATNRVLAPINDKIEGTININYADINVTGVMCNGAAYNNRYVNKPLEYTVDFTTSVTAPSSGFKIQYRESVAEGWSAAQSGVTASVTPMGGYNTGDKTYRFRLLALNSANEWVEVSNATTEPVTFLYDDFIPETQYISSYADGTWHTADTDVIINPKPVTRYAEASVVVRFIDESGNPIAGADGEWHKADETFMDEEGFWVDGFKISAEGKTYFELKALSVTGAEGAVKRYEVWIDRSDYSIDYEVSFVSGDPLDKAAVTLTGKTLIKRDETPKLTFATTENGALSYYIADIDGSAYENKAEAAYDYSIPLDMTIGGTPDTIKVKVRKGVKLTFTAPPSTVYGDAITLPEPAAEGLVGADTLADLGVTLSYVGSELTTAGVKGVGKHEFTAAINNDDYVATVENSFVEVTPKELKLDLKASYRFKLNEYLGFGESAWERLGLDILDKTLILAGDSVSVSGVTYDKEITAYGSYNFKGILDNANYKLPADEKGILALAMLDYDYDALEGLGAYLVRTAEDFENFNKYPAMLNQNYVLLNDIDLASVADASANGVFTGTFDGNNHRIYNVLMVNYGLDKYGLFREINGGTVKNLVIDNMSIGIYTASKTVSNVGLLAGAVSGAVIDNVIIRGEIRVTDESAQLNVGGIVGSAVDSSITNIAYLATIEVNSTGKVSFGGAVGDANNVIIENAEFIGIASITSVVTESAVGYVTADGGAGATITNAKYINRSAGLNGTRVDNTAVGTASTYAELAASAAAYAGMEYGAMLKGSIDPRYFGANVYGTGADDAFVIRNYNQLVATVIYPYATFKLANNILCHTVNSFDPSAFFGTLDMNGYSITDIGGKPINAVS